MGCGTSQLRKDIDELGVKLGAKQLAVLKVKDVIVAKHEVLVDHAHACVFLHPLSDDVR